MSAAVPFAANLGVRLIPTDTEGIASAEVLDADQQYSLPWDRFMRLRTTADHLRRLVGSERKVRILDVGGFDGAFAMFVPGHDVDVIDPATTGGSGLKIPVPDRAYDVVVSIDAIEHLPLEQRGGLLAELARVTGSICLVNFPNKATMPAQELVYKLTGNPFVREHVEFGLPEKQRVVEQMQGHGFECLAVPSTSLALWAAQFTLSNLHPEAAAAVSRYLVTAHREEPFSVPLYLLIICTRPEPAG
jgi:hypothetical protein